MKHAPLIALSLALAFGAALTNAQTTNSRIGELTYEVGFPTKEAVDKLYEG